MKRIFFILSLYLLELLINSSQAYAEVQSAPISHDPTLVTQTGHELGLTYSAYRYREPSLGVKISSNEKIGIEYTGTLLLNSKFFVRTDLRYATGDAYYEGSGTKNISDDFYYDVRGLIGKDIYTTERLAFAPYIGYGYRFLYNDMRGLTSTGAWGYRRESQYWYLPIGIVNKISLNDGAHVETTLEYDYLIQGLQTTYLSDTNGYSYYRWNDASNRQHNGYGLRISSLYKTDHWSVGPYFIYWSIDQSETERVQGVERTFYNDYYDYLSVYEPKNYTQEYGIKVSYQF